MPPQAVVVWTEWRPNSAASQKTLVFIGVQKLTGQRAETSFRSSDVLIPQCLWSASPNRTTGCPILSLTDRFQAVSALKTKSMH